MEQLRAEPLNTADLEPIPPSQALSSSRELEHAGSDAPRSDIDAHGNFISRV